jgi:hypothetical protein
MEILIHLDRSEPPAGTIARPAGADDLTHGSIPVAFVGWLGMLRAMYEVLGFTPPGD